MLCSFGQTIEFFYDFTNDLYSCFGLVLSLRVIIVTLGPRLHLVGVGSPV